MRTILLTLSMIFSSTTYCQTEVRNDSIRQLQTDKHQMQNAGDSEASSKEKLNIDEPDYSVLPDEVKEWDKHRKDSLLRKLNIYVPAYYVGPGENFDRIPTTNPFENDYLYYSNWDIGLGRRAWMSTASTRFTYPSLGSSATIDAMLNFKITDRWIVSGGPFMSKNFMNGNMFTDVGYGGTMSYIITDRFIVNAFGQYSAYAKHNFIGSNTSGMFNQTSYGGTFEYKINDSWGVQAGMKRELDPFTGKWKNIPIFGPVFYGKKK